MNTATLLLSCHDQPGLVAAVSDFIYRHDGNILHANQHIDRREGLFLQRVEWDLASFQIAKPQMQAAIEQWAKPFGMQWSLHFSQDVPKVAILVSKHAHCLYDLLARWKNGELRVDVQVVLSNHTDLRHVAECFGVPFVHCPLTPESKPQQEQQLHETLGAYGIDLVVLARYMQVLSDGFVGRYPNRIINIHHSFLPAFPGARPYHRAHERGVKIIGATAHYVTEELDEGPIIEQDVVRVSHRDSIEDLIAKGRDLEKLVLARAVSLHVEARVLVYGRRTVVFR